MAIPTRIIESPIFTRLWSAMNLTADDLLAMQDVMLTHFSNDHLSSLVVAVFAKIAICTAKSEQRSKRCDAGDFHVFRNKNELFSLRWLIQKV